MKVMRCPKGHILSETKSVFSCKYGVYKKYKCECNDRYIYAPDYPKESFYVKEKGYFIVNLSYILHDIDNGLTFDKSNKRYMYKYNDKNINVAFKNKKRKYKMCPKCNNVLVKLDLFIPIDDAPFGHEVGRYCKNCSLMFFSKKEIERLKFYKINMSQEELNNNIVKDAPNIVKEVTKRISLINSHIVWCYNVKNCYKCNSKLTIVESPYVNNKGEIKNISHKYCENCKINYIPKELIYFDFCNNNNVVLDTPIIIGTQKKESKKENNKSKNNVGKKLIKNIKKSQGKVNPNCSLEEVSVYDSINVSCVRKHKEFVIQTPLKFKSLEINCVKTANGFYCKKCNKKFITSEAIYNYTDKHFVPQFKCVVVNSSNVKNLNDESVLALYGYTVKANYLLDDERHSILEYVLNNGIMTATDVINLLEFNIKFKSNNLSMRNACEKWYEDIQYIYKIK